MDQVGFGPGLSEGGPKTIQEREREFIAAGMTKPLSAGGGRGPSLPDLRLFENEGILKIVQGMAPIPIPGVAGLLPKALAIGGAIYAGAQALGLGEGSGLFGNDLLGGNQPQGPPPGVGGSVPFEGPGLREPSAQYVVKEWKRRIDSRDGDYNLQFYLTQMPGRAYRIYMYSQRTGGWKSWGLPRPAVIGKNMPSHKMLTRLRRNLKKHADDAKTILMIASPTAYAKNLGYKKPAHRHHR